MPLRLSASNASASEEEARQDAVVPEVLAHAASEDERRLGRMRSVAFADDVEEHLIPGAQGEEERNRARRAGQGPRESDGPSSPEENSSLPFRSSPERHAQALLARGQSLPNIARPRPATPGRETAGRVYMLASQSLQSDIL
jgi:hypothetical protein